MLKGTPGHIAMIRAAACRVLSGTIVYFPTATILAFTSSLESQAVLLSVMCCQQSGRPDGIPPHCQQSGHMPEVPGTAMSLAYRVVARSQNPQGPVKAFIAPDLTPKKSAAF